MYSSTSSLYSTSNKFCNSLSNAIDWSTDEAGDDLRSGGRLCDWLLVALRVDTDAGIVVAEVEEEDADALLDDEDRCEVAWSVEMGEGEVRRLGSKLVRLLDKVDVVVALMLRN